MVMVKTLEDLYDDDSFSVEVERYIRETGNKVTVIWGEAATISRLYLQGDD